MPAILVDDVQYAVPDEEYAFSGVLTSDGRVAGIEMLQSGAVIDERAMELLRSIHDSRFQPARLKDGRAVAVKDSDADAAALESPSSSRRRARRNSRYASATWLGCAVAVPAASQTASASSKRIKVSLRDGVGRQAEI